MPVLFGRRATLSNAGHEALIEVEHELLIAAAEKSLVTILPNASQGDVNWAIGALPAIAPYIMT